MKKLILLVLVLSGIALAYFEQNDGVPEVFSDAGTQNWRMWSGQDAASKLYDNSVGILFDDLLLTVIVGNFTPGASRTRHTAVGFNAGIGFDGDFTTSVGNFAGEKNTADFHTAIGVLAGIWNEGAKNTALGETSFNAFNLDTGSAKEVTSVDFANNRMTVSGGHGFGANGTFRNLIATTTETLPEGLNGAIHTWEIISSTILEVKTDSFTDAGSGTHTLTPQFIYTNSTALGYNAEPDASNQVVLGDTNVTEVKTSGSLSVGGGITLGGNIIIPDDGLIGSVSDTDAIQIEADGDVVMTQDLAVSGAVTANEITTTEFTVEPDGDTFWSGNGTGLPHASVWGNDIAFTQAAAVQDTWYPISDTDISTGSVNEATHDGMGQLTIGKNGKYDIFYCLASECDTQNKHVETGIQVDGTTIGDARQHYHLPNVAAMTNTEFPMSSGGTIDIAAGQTVNVAIRTTDAGLPDLKVDHINLKLFMVGGRATSTDTLLLEDGDGLLLENDDGILLES